MANARAPICLAAAAAAACAHMTAPAPRPALGYADYAALYARLRAGEPPKALEDALPGLAGNLATAREVSRRWWTDSTPYDELVHRAILDDRMLDALGIPHRVDSGVEHVPAGMMHTYGYLFSQLKTAYGLKGKRWIESRLDERLGLPAGAFSPRPPSGEFASNVTAALSALIGADFRPPRAAALKPRARSAGAVVERVRWRRPDGTEVDGVVRTHLVALGGAPGLVSSDSFLLIYELELSGERRLVTAFPVSADFARTLERTKPVVDAAFRPRFNLYVDPAWVVLERRVEGFVPAR